MKRSLTVTALAAALTFASAARAQSHEDASTAQVVVPPSSAVIERSEAPAPPPPPAVDSEVVVASRFERTLSYYGTLGRHTRWATSGILFGVGVGYTGAGLLLLRDSHEPAVQYTFIGLGAGITLLGLLPLVMRDPLEELRDEYVGSLRGGASPVDAMRRAEARWGELADSERRLRRGIGWASVVTGALAVSFAPVLPLIRPSVSDVDRLNPILFGVAGGALVGLGIAMLMIPGNMERSHDLWQISQGRVAGLSLGMPTVAVSEQGASLALQGTF